MRIATSTAVYNLDDTDIQTSPHPQFEGQGVRCVAEDRDCTVIALKGGKLIFQTGQPPRTLDSGIPEPINSLLPLDDALLVGVEGPHIYRCTGDTVARVEAFDGLECRSAWYTPWGGPPELRSMARTRDGWVYADIHVGSIMRSADAGATWEPVTPGLHKDVHQVVTSPQTDERVYANTAHAVYISEDRGQSWTHRDRGFPARYGRAIAVHPHDPDCLLATVSNGPGRNVSGKLFRTDNAGKTWAHVTDGFPEATKDNIDTFHVAFSPRGLAWAVVGPDLYLSEDRGQTWSSFWTAPEPILMIASQN